MSPANVAKIIFWTYEKSFVYSKYIIGSRILPWATEYSSSCSILYILSQMYDVTSSTYCIVLYLFQLVDSSLMPNFIEGLNHIEKSCRTYQFLFYDVFYYIRYLTYLIYRGVFFAWIQIDGFGLGVFFLLKFFFSFFKICFAIIKSSAILVYMIWPYQMFAFFDSIITFATFQALSANCIAEQSGRVKAVACQMQL